MLSTVLWRWPVALLTAWVEILTELLLETKKQFNLLVPEFYI